MADDGDDGMAFDFEEQLDAPALPAIVSTEVCNE
jgi:hypothetical protein